MKIIKINNKSSHVLINGKKFELPVILNPKLNYSAKIVNNKIEIIELAKRITEKDNQLSKSNFNDLFDNFFYESHNKNFNEITNIFYAFFNYLDKMLNKNYNKKRKYIIFKKDENKINIFLNINFFNRDSKFFINFTNFDVNISILVDNLNKIYKEQFISDLKLILMNKINNLVINFFDKKNNFYENIKCQMDLKKVDLKI
ncbi:MAG: hypothetical protein JXB50_02625 [Spirochaetes bacterium]|nr:hypothetical protein [Spirochaetota bacterium]